MQNNVEVLAQTKFMRSERVFKKVYAGTTIDEIVGGLGMHPEVIMRCRVWVYHQDGRADIVPYHMWKMIRPKPGTRVVVKPSVHGGGGGGGKNPLALVATIAVIVVAVVLAPELAPFIVEMGFSAAAAEGIAFAAVTMIGMAAVTMLMGAPAPAARDFNMGSGEPLAAPKASITGTRNQASPWGAVPRVFGRRKVFPLLAARTYSETVGGDTYFRALFCFGEGPLQIEDICIGDTPITAYTNVEYEVRQGFENDAPTTLFASTVKEKQFNNVLLSGNDIKTVDSSSSALAIGSPVERAVASDDADAAEVEITFPGGLGTYNPPPAYSGPFSGGDGGWQYWIVGGNIVYSEPQGGYGNQSASFAVDVDTTGAGAWGAATGKITAVSGCSVAGSNINVTNATGGSFTVKFRVESARGAQWKFRVTRQNDSTGKASNLTKTTSIAEPWVQRTADIDANELSFDVTFKSGLAHYNDAGGRSPATVVIRAQYRAVGATAWTDCPELLTVTDSEATAFKAGVRWKPPVKGDYEVRVRRTTPDATSDRLVDKVYFTNLRAITTDHPIKRKGLALLALRIKETEGGPLDQVSAICTSMLPIWNGTSWSAPTATRNAAWAFCEVARGGANKKAMSDDKLDLPSILAWAQANDAASPQNDGPMFTYDAVHDRRSTVERTLREIAASSRANFTMIDGKITIVRDVKQTSPWQHFTPRNASEFKATRIFVERPHGLKIRFVNPDVNWQEDEVTVYDTGYNASNATLFEQIDMMACTRPQQAWREGMYQFAVSKLRPAIYELTTDVEHIVCKMGDMVRVAYDVPMWGQNQAKIASVLKDSSQNVTTIILDAPVQMETGNNYCIRFRRSRDNGSFITNVQNFGTNETTTIVPASPLSPDDAPEPGDLAMFGKVNQESVEMIVKGFARGEDMSARMFLLDDAPAVHDSWTGVIPPFVSNISRPSEVTTAKPPAPVFEAVRDVYEKIGGSIVTSTVVEFSAPFVTDITIAAFELQYRPVGSAAWRGSQRVGSSANAITAVGVASGTDYVLRLRSISAAGVPSDWTSEHTHTVQSIPAPVAPVPTTHLDDMKNSIIEWPSVIDIRTMTYEIKKGLSYSTAQVVAVTASNSFVAESNKPYWITPIGDGMRGTPAGIQSLEVPKPTKPKTSAYYNKAGNLILTWDQDPDPRQIIYEVRKGEHAGGASVVARIAGREFVALGNDNYWIYAVATNQSAPSVYSDPAVEIVTGARLVDNVIAVQNERLDGWTGTRGGSLAVYPASGPYKDRLAGSLFTSSGTKFSDIPLVSAVDRSIVIMDSLISSGTYVLPVADIVDIGTAQNVAVSVNFKSRGENLIDLVSSYLSVASVDSFAGGAAGLTTCQLMMSIGDDNGVFGPWLPFLPGIYSGRLFNFSVELASYDDNVAVILDELLITVDVPDVVQTGESLLAPAGTTITFPKAFHNFVPLIQGTIEDALAGDQLVIYNRTLTGFSARVINGGSGATRNLLWAAQGH